MLVLPMSLAFALAFAPTPFAPTPFAPDPAAGSPDPPAGSSDPPAGSPDPPAGSPDPAVDELRLESELEADAQAAFQAGDYARVIELAARAYALTGAVRHLYAQAQAMRLDGRCETAVALYGRVLAANPEDALGVRARAAIHLCEEQMRASDPLAAPEASPPSDTPATAPTAAARSADDPPPVRRWIRDPLGGVLFGLGVAGVAAGTTLLITSSGATRAAESSADESDYEQRRRRATRHLGGAVAALVGGGLLVVGAALRYSSVARRSKRDTRPVVRLGARPVVRPGARGAWLSVSGRF